MQKSKFNIFMWLLFLFVSLPIFSFPDIRWGLDPSWMYFINRAYPDNIIFGKDIYFTYGPLGYIFHALNIDNNRLIYGIFIIVFFIYNSYSLYCFVTKKNHKPYVLLAALILFVLFPIKNMRCYTLFTLLNITFMAFENKSSYFHFGLLCLFVSIFFLVKFDIAFLSLFFAVLVIFCRIANNIFTRWFIRYVWGCPSE